MINRLINRIWGLPTPKFPIGTRVRIVQCHQKGKLIDISSAPIEGVIKGACPILKEYGEWGYNIDCGGYCIEALQGGIYRV